MKEKRLMGKEPSGVLWFYGIYFSKFLLAEQGAFYGNDFCRNGIGCGQGFRQ